MRKYVKPFVGIYSGVLDYLENTVCKDCKVCNDISACVDFRVWYMEFGKQYERFV